MKITVERLSDDLNREAWEFDFSPGKGIRLCGYMEQVRKTKRSKWVGPFWSWMDERSYHSKLPRPNYIPADILEEAREAIRREVWSSHVYIGWFNDEARFKEPKP